MPTSRAATRARKDRREGKAPSTQAGEFVREEVRDTKSSGRSRKQAIAIGLSKARRSGVKLPAPKRGQATAATRRKATQDLKKGRAKAATRSRKRS